jgi:hypothetical protein
VFAGTGSVYRTQPTLSVGDLKGDVSRSVADSGGALDLFPSKVTDYRFQNIHTSKEIQKYIEFTTV